MEELTNQIQNQNNQIIQITNQLGEIQILKDENQQLNSKLNELNESLSDKSNEIQEKSDKISSLELNIQEIEQQLLNSSRSLQKLELEKESLKVENESIRNLVSQHENSNALDQQIQLQQQSQKENQSLNLQIMEKNNLIEDKDKEINQLNESIEKLKQDIIDLQEKVENEKANREKDLDHFNQEKELLNRKHIEDQVDKEQVAEKVISDLKGIIDNIGNERDTIQKEANNLAQRLSNQVDKCQELETNNLEYQREITSIVSTRDNLIKELEELNLKIQSTPPPSTNTTEQFEQLEKEILTLREKYKADLDQFSIYKQQWESNRWEIVAELEQEKMKSKKIQESLMEEKRVMGVVSKTVSKLLSDNEKNSFESMTPESFYALLEATKKELSEGLHNKKKYYDDEDFMGQLVMEREARRLAESQVEHFAVLLEKAKSEILKYKEIINNGGASGGAKSSSFLSNIMKSINGDNNNTNNNNGFLKRTFTGSNNLGRNH